MRRVDIQLVLLMSLVVAACLPMVYYASRFESHVAGALGPGVFPMMVLILAIGMALFIAFQAFTLPEHTIFSPFPAGSKIGLIVEKIADLLSKELNSRVLVIIRTGEGFFSAVRAGSEAAPDGKTLTVITNSVSAMPNFVGAAVCAENFEPVMGLSFEPDLLVAAAGKGDQLEGAGVLKRAETIKMGFSHPPGAPYYLREALQKKTGAEIQGYYFDDTKSLMEALEKGQIDAGFCPMLRVLETAESGEKYKALAVASPRRVYELPNIPTLRELGLDLVSGCWTGLGFPRGTSRDDVEYIYSILTKPENVEILKGEMKEKGERGSVSDPESFTGLLMSQKKVLEELGIEDVSRYYKSYSSLYRLMFSMALFVAFILTLPYSSFLPGSFVFLAVLSFILWPAKAKSAIPVILTVSGCVSFGVYEIFSRIFNVVFP